MEHQQQMLHVNGVGGNFQEEVIQYYQASGLQDVAQDSGVVQDHNNTIIIDSTQSSQPTTYLTTATGEIMTLAGGQEDLKLISTPNKIQSRYISLSTASPSYNQTQLIYQQTPTSKMSQSPQLLQLSTPKTTGTDQRPIYLLLDNQSAIASTQESPVVIADAESQISPGSATRKRPYEVLEEYPDGTKRYKRSGENRMGKGLRHFSMKVCEKVQCKGCTTYNEVADELVSEFSNPAHHASPIDQQYDQKNIRRRVYDALNVLMAMNIISKDKKEIRWLGLPTNSAQECHNLEVEKQKRLDRIKQKTNQLQELILQQIAFKNLVERNMKLEKQRGSKPSSNTCIQLPFIIVSTHRDTVIDCSISNDKFEYLFNFNNTFEIHDDIEVLKRMGMAFGLEDGSCSQENLAKARKMIPRALEPYLLDLANGTITSTMSMVAGPSGVQSRSGSSLRSPGSIVLQTADNIRKLQVANPNFNISTSSLMRMSEPDPTSDEDVDIVV